MSTRTIVDPWNFQTYTYDWNEDEDPSPDQEMSILQKERQRRNTQPPPRVDADSLLSKISEPAPSIVRPRQDIAPVEPPKSPWELAKDWMGGQIEDIRQNFGSTVSANARELAANEERNLAPDIERLGVLARPVVESPIGRAVGLSAEPTIKERYPGIIERQPGEEAGIPELKPAVPEPPVDELAARRRAAGRSTLDFVTDPTNLALMAATVVEPQMAPLIGLGFGGPMATESAATMTEKGLKGELPDLDDVAKFVIGTTIAGGGGALKEGVKTGFREAGEFARFSNPMRESPLGAEAGVFKINHEGLPPTDWLVRNGYRMKKGGWYNDEGKLVPYDQINAEYAADQAVRAAQPQQAFEQPNVQMGFEDWRNQPENQRFFGGRLSPERMKDALTAYNNYATEFAAKKAASVPQASSAPKSVEEVMGDVGELPAEEPTGDFAKDVLEKPVETPPVEEPAPAPPETVQPANVSEPAPVEPKPEEIGQPIEGITPTEPPGKYGYYPDGTPRHLAKIPGRHELALEAEARASLVPAPAEEPAPASTWPEVERRKTPRGQAPPEPMPEPDFTPIEPLPESPTKGELLKDIENIPAEPLPPETPHASPQELAKEHPLVKAYREDPNHINLESFDGELTPTEAGVLLQEEPGLAKYPWMKRALGLEEAPSPVETVHPASGTIDSGTVQPETPAAPGKIVPGPETIVQEASKTAPTEPTPAQATSPEQVKLTLDNVLEEMYPGKEAWSKKEIQAARKELMSRLRGKKTEKAAAAEAALQEKIAETPLAPGETPPKNVAKVKGEGEPPKLPLGSPGLASRIFLDLRTNLAKIHPHLARWVEKFQRESELPAMSAIAERRVLTEGLNKPQQNAMLRVLDEKGAEEAVVALQLKDNVKLRELVAKDPTLKEVIDTFQEDPSLFEKAAGLRELLDQVHQAAEKNKVAIGYRQHYFPHYFKEGGFRPNVQPKAMPRTGTHTRRMSKLEKSRLSMRTDYIKDLNVLDEYFMQSYQRISEAENFGKRHEKLAKWFEQTEGVDPRVAQYFDKGIQRITGNEEPSWIRGALGKARRLQALSDLGLAAPLQLGQASHTSAYGGVMRSLEAAKDMTAGERAIAMRALRSGALTPDIGIESLGAARGGGATSGKFLWGIPTMDKAMRVHAFRVGELLYRDAMTGNAGAIRSLKRLGIEDVKKVTAEQVGKALSDKTQFKTGHLDLPLWSTSPLGRTATMYTSFMYQHTKFMGQMFKNPVQNAPAIARFAIIGALAGEGVGDIRAVLKGRNPIEDEKFRHKEAKWIETLRNRRIPWSDPAKRLIQNYALLGGAGLFQTYFERLNAPDVTLTGVAGGPLASNAEDLLREVARQKKAKEKAKAAGRWALEQVPVFGYEIAGEVLPPKKRSTPDPLLDVEY